MFMVNTRVDVVGHFEERMRRWLVVRMTGVINQPDVGERDFMAIARRMVAALVWNERKEGAQALAAGRPWPRPPRFQMPTSLLNVVGDELILRLDHHSRREVWTLFQWTVGNVGGSLPLCPTNYGRSAESAK
jgi:hypothetical protein